MRTLDLLKAMSDERFLAIYEGLARLGFGPLDGDVAKAMKFRPQAIKKLPMDKRARKARSILEQSANAQMTYELFGSYLLHARKGVVTSFLDTVGIPHEDGMISVDLAEHEPSAEQVEQALAKLDAEHDANDVTLYLALCAEHWPRNAAIQEALEKRTAQRMKS
jgi:hypothetical protein